MQIWTIPMHLKETTFFEKGIHTFVDNCVKYYNKGRRSIEPPQAYPM